MGMFLHNKTPYDLYRQIRNGPFFVDKSLLICELLPALNSENRFLCITRPRRFGKSIMADMVCSFFDCFVNSRAIFDGLAISRSEAYEVHLNRHHVFFIDFSEVPEKCDSYDSYISRILHGMKDDLKEIWPQYDYEDKAIWDILSEIFQDTGTKFVFVMDEWDTVFHMPFVNKTERQSFLLFLKSILKGKAYVELAYMTGILPIAKYSGGSELNMFLEYDMATKKKFSEYFGFSEEETDRLFEIYQNQTESPEITRDALRDWYDGYHTAAGKRLYNPRSVVCALSENELSNYWTSSGPYDEIFYYIKNNIDAVRDDMALMVSGEAIPATLQGYSFVDTELKTKNQIYSAMIVYGLLTYEHKSVSIPNRELMDKYNELLLENESLGYVHRLAIESERMLRSTLAGDTQTMTRILKLVHDTEVPILSYNYEVELAAIVNLVYLSARDRYRVEREDKAGEGFVDFIFYPEITTEPSIILELKVDDTPDAAIEQIIRKNYQARLQGKIAEKPRYTGKILTVGIGYDRKTKKHACKVVTLT